MTKKIKELKKNKIELDYVFTSTDVGVTINNTDVYHIKMSENVVEMKDDNGKKIKYDSDLYNEILTFLIQNSAII